MKVVSLLWDSIGDVYELGSGLLPNVVLRRRGISLGSVSYTHLIGCNKTDENKGSVCVTEREMM